MLIYNEIQYFEPICDLEFGIDIENVVIVFVHLRTSDYEWLVILRTSDSTILDPGSPRSQTFVQ